MIQNQWLKNDNGYLIQGELTRDTVPELWQHLQQWKPNEAEVEVSLQKTVRVDSAGMAMLIHLIQHAKNNNCHIMLSFVPTQLRMLFKLSNVNDMLVDNIKD